MRCPQCSSSVGLRDAREQVLCKGCGAILRLPIERLLVITFGLGWLPWIVVEGLVLRFNYVPLSVATFLLSHGILFALAFWTLSPRKLD